MHSTNIANFYSSFQPAEFLQILLTDTTQIKIKETIPSCQKQYVQLAELLAVYYDWDLGKTRSHVYLADKTCKEATTRNSRTNPDSSCECWSVSLYQDIK